MHNIQMVDLKGQYQKIKPEIDKALLDALDKTAFIQGPEVKKFEQELAGYNQVKYCISCANGTDALQIAMMALDLKPGDEVIVPAFTYIATVEAAALLGLKTVLVEAEPGTFNINPEAIRKAITAKTKLIVPVHLFGQCADMESIVQIAKENNIAVLEDTAQAIGAQYHFKNGKSVFAGGMGTIGITSFFPSKNLGCYGDGGALFTNDESLAKKIKMIANHGQEKKYYHDIIGVNSRLDTVQAAILSVKLKYLNQYIKSRQEAADFYDKALGNHTHFGIPERSKDSTHVFHQYTLKIKDGKRDALKAHLEAKGIPTMVYYPVPIHLQKAFGSLGYKKGDFPVSEKHCESVISLPMHTELTKEELNYIIDNILNFFKS
ncbi:MAG: DegT/DnrJ/EryC1/StrS family aminotransferase [Cytophagaceae bacterium]|nr:DegT/DnrJ/EryC1/StrS family aminotransferase [Cytophagaceae bacterium]